MLDKRLQGVVFANRACGQACEELLRAEAAEAREAVEGCMRGLRGGWGSKGVLGGVRKAEVSVAKLEQKAEKVRKNVSRANEEKRKADRKLQSVFRRPIA